jgi:hypothetical protein
LWNFLRKDDFMRVRKYPLLSISLFLLGLGLGLLVADPMSEICGCKVTSVSTLGIAGELLVEAEVV